MNTQQHHTPALPSSDTHRAPPEAASAAAARRGAGTAQDSGMCVGIAVDAANTAAAVDTSRAASTAGTVTTAPDAHRRSAPRRSHAPVFWLLFGAGGTLSALLGSVLVLVTGLLVPLHIAGFGAHTLAYPRMLAFAQSLWGKGLLLMVIVLFAWHAMHRLYKSLHDVGIPPGFASRALCYGIASAISLTALCALLLVGM